MVDAPRLMTEATRLMTRFERRWLRFSDVDDFREYQHWMRVVEWLKTQ